MNMAQVGIVMGSDSDLKVMGKARDLLEEFGVESEVRVISAHREPDVFFEYAKSAEGRGLKVTAWMHSLPLCRCLRESR